MGTTTPNLGLDKPAVSETGWSALVNTNMDILDGLPQFLPNHLIRYVDYTNGNDGAAATRGLGPGYAYKTIQAAYNELKTTANANYTAFSNNLGVGRIQLLPGDHDVGSGLVIDSQRPVELIGFRAGENDNYTANSGARVVSSSASVTTFVTVAHAAAIGRGMRFRDVHFMIDTNVNTSVTKIIHTTSCDYIQVDHCSFGNKQSSTLSNTATAIFMDTITPPGGNSDSAWFRIRDNMCTNFQFFQCAGVNLNRAVMDGNVCTYDGTNPIVYLNGDVLGCCFSNNNLEGAACAMRLDDSGALGINDNIFMNNSGESPSSANPFYDVIKGSRNLFIGGNCDAADGTTGTWINFGTAAWNNVVIGPYSPVGQAGRKYKIVDGSTGGWNVVIGPNWGAPIRRFTVTPVTDALYTASLGTPPDGTQALTDVSGVRKLWVRSGGAWYGTVVS